MKKKLLLLLSACLTILLMLSGCSAATNIAASKDYETRLLAGVIIYEAYTSGGYSSGENYAPFRYGYVVLYNKTQDEISLDGWSLRYCENNSTRVIPEMTTALSGSIGPGQFFVIQCGSAPDAPDKPFGDDLPFFVNVTSPDFRMDRKSGAIALCDGGAGDADSLTPGSVFVQDYLAYAQDDEPTDYYEGAGPVIGVSVKRVLRRVSFADTDNNASDFDTKDIVDKPGNIIRYTEGLTSAELMSRENRSKASVSFSHQAGYYDSEFLLSLSTDLGSDATIYYTTDGSLPVTPAGVISESAMVYDEPVRIFNRTGESPYLMNMSLDSDAYDDKWPPVREENETEEAYLERLNTFFDNVYQINVIRAAAVSEDQTVTPTITNPYIIYENPIQERYGLPLISITTDKENLYGEDIGIFLSENRELRDTEARRPAAIHFFEPDGTLAFTEPASIQLNGGYTRRYPQKALRVNMSNEDFIYDLFDGRAKTSSGQVITYFDRFVLRAGGNDWENGGLRDVFWQSYCSRLGTFDVQAARPCIVFLNGELWGIYNITERQDDYYIESHYGIPREYVAIVESFSGLKEGDRATATELTELRNFVIENDMTVEDNYRRFSDIVDVDSFIDYFICEIYCGNTDWPHNNLRMWRDSRPDATEHNKWRMMMQDVDFAFWSSPSDYDNLGALLDEEKMNSDNPIQTAEMFAALMKNNGFRNAFVSRFDELLDSFFVPEEIIAVFDAFSADIEPVIQEQLERWNLNEKDWSSVRKHIINFLDVRNETMRKALDQLQD